MTPATACAAGCGRPSPNAFLCGECTGELRGALLLAASIEGDLLAAVARQLRHGAGRRTGDGQLLPYDPAASAARQALSLALADAIHDMPGTRWPLPDTSIAGMAQWLLQHMGDVVQQPFAGRTHHEVASALARAVRVLDPPPERAYAGPCPGCGADVLAPPGAALARCRQCGCPVDVDAQQAAMRTAVEDMLGGAAWCVRMAARLGLHAPESTIYSWARRGQLAAHGQRAPERGGDPQPVYRLGDVLDLAARNPRVRG